MMIDYAQYLATRALGRFVAYHVRVQPRSSKRKEWVHLSVTYTMGICHHVVNTSSFDLVFNSPMPDRHHHVMKHYKPHTQFLNSDNLSDFNSGNNI